MIPLILDPDVFPPPLPWPLMHPQRWWWTNANQPIRLLGAVFSDDAPSLRFWRRDDGATVTMPSATPTRAEIDEVLASYDAEHPMAIPQPKIGMVVQIATDPTTTVVCTISHMNVDIRGKVRGLFVSGFAKALPTWPLPGMRILAPTPWAGDPLPEVVAPTRPRLQVPGVRGEG